MWSDAWIGLPYATRGRGPDVYDCLGLYLALNAARLGRVLPDPGCDQRAAVRNRVVAVERIRYRPVETAEEGDAILFRAAGRPLHVAYAIDDRDMLHIGQDTGVSVLERWRASRWLCRLEGIFRPHA
ncbi:NlpC/P60 family protein [Roseivivax isoporae]|uniref:Tail assembly protein n=1 Tax=Roseivivax isoporae LMG 25204 TaxID=1449351 RepID=X7F414_9RHOB|nr:NlpC/P60 family protein [Roseivivax isoporae]ETX26846.1 tail assembly protein [Roseivivax isoporae LMG 25204]